MDLGEILKAIVNGPPRLAEELFRATKAPSIVILLVLGSLGAIVAFSVVYASSTHSYAPYYVLELGIGQLLNILWGPDPALAHAQSVLIIHVTPAGQRLAMALAWIILGSAFVLFWAGFWWFLRFCGFISAKVQGLGG
jgi:hypothetical protein